MEVERGVEEVKELRKIVKEKYIVDYKVSDEAIIIDVIAYFDIRKICTEKTSEKYEYESCIESMMEEINVDYAYNNVNIETNDYVIFIEPVECENDNGCYAGTRIIVKFKVDH